MGRMPTNFAVNFVADVSIISVFFYNLGCFGEGEIKPFAVSAGPVDFCVCHLKVNRFFQLVRKFCFNKSPVNKVRRAPYLQRPPALPHGAGRVSYLYRRSVGYKINYSSHKFVTLLTARVSRVCLALPCRAVPRLAGPRHAAPCREKLSFNSNARRIRHPEAHTRRRHKLDRLSDPIVGVTTVQVNHCFKVHPGRQPERD